MRLIDQKCNEINLSALKKGDLIFISRKRPSVWHDECRIFIRFVDYRIHHVGLGEYPPCPPDDVTKDDARDMQYVMLLASAGAHYKKRFLRDIVLESLECSRLKEQLNRAEERIATLALRFS